MPDDSVVAEHYNAAIPCELVREISKWTDQGASFKVDSISPRGTGTSCLRVRRHSQKSWESVYYCKLLAIHNL